MKSKLIGRMVAAGSLAFVSVTPAVGSLPVPEMRHIREIVKANLEKTPTPNFEKDRPPFEPDLFWWLQPRYQD